ncbi:tRNA pseudouridine(38-40) synthase TruA [Palaeococcus ferrophilus]|uniref:tRNA pseudouridine(38-40) synthase TruA n=1 Tax=Palaeococcus ferrophilus TaxID=83868 RepID=UPI00064F4809|nr:tRNA pseudouridine(38-40) synthase TruA [Palaeococcus ferrophilus]
MERVALKVAYDGSAFYGFQRQPGLRTVEGEILRALTRVGIIEDAKSANFRGASRTDRGVSALGNVVAFDTERPELTLPRILNHHLRDVWVVGRAVVPPEFNPRYASRGKTYRYYVAGEVDMAALRECASLFVGRHDFSNFARLEKHKNPVRTIKSIEVLQEGPVTVLEFRGESFLWEMVRRITTALLLCSRGELSTGEVRAMLNREVEKKLPPAPPENLVLWEVELPGVTFEMGSEAREKIERDFFERYARAAVRAALFSDFLRAF